MRKYAHILLNAQYLYKCECIKRIRQLALDFGIYMYMEGVYWNIKMKEC